MWSDLISVGCEAGWGGWCAVFNLKAQVDLIDHYCEFCKAPINLNLKFSIVSSLSIPSLAGLVCTALDSDLKKKKLIYLPTYLPPNLSGFISFSFVSLSPPHLALSLFLPSAVSSHSVSWRARAHTKSNV